MLLRISAPHPNFWKSPGPNLCPEHEIILQMLKELHEVREELARLRLEICDLRGRLASKVSYYEFYKLQTPSLDNAD